MDTNLYSAVLCDLLPWLFTTFALRARREIPESSSRDAWFTKSDVYMIYIFRRSKTACSVSPDCRTNYQNSTKIPARQLCLLLSLLARLALNSSLSATASCSIPGSGYSVIITTGWQHQEYRESSCRSAGAHSKRENSSPFFLLHCFKKNQAYKTDTRRETKGNPGSKMHTTGGEKKKRYSALIDIDDRINIHLKFYDSQI